ncbi:MAG: DUF4037 domain-containing protein [Candidatus Hodarchaeales archaeon]|jgi:hypothetical protein
MALHKDIPGLKLSELFYEEIVKRLIDQFYPEIRYAAALIGPSSEVLGYDDIISRDHHWGPRLLLFLDEKDYQKYAKKLDIIFRDNLPVGFLGYSTNWSEPDPEDNMTQMLVPTSKGPINHRIEIHTVKSYLKKNLSISSLNLNQKDWIMLSEQKLLEFTSGKVFHDSAGDLTEARKKLHYYPENVWKFKLMGIWKHIDQEIAFVGRTGVVGDDLGSRIEASRLVRYIMMITFVINKKYIPYAKWIGVGFKKLPLGIKLEPLLKKILEETEWKKREELLCEAYLILLEKQNMLGITLPLILNPKSFHNRPQTVIDTCMIVKELKKTITPPLSTIKHPIGTINEFIDSTDMITDPSFIKLIIQIENL